MLIDVGIVQFEVRDWRYPCPRGYSGDAVKECTCSNSVVTRYQGCRRLQFKT